MSSRPSGSRIDSFGFVPGQILASKYEVRALLGVGWESEVYLVRERGTGIERTFKCFFPHRNIRDQAAKRYARKLHKLRQCPIIIQYHGRETMRVRDLPVTCLVSEFVEGELLSRFLRRQPGRRLSPFQAVHLLHALASGIEHIHRLGEYHGDLHTDNIIVLRYGLGFDLKLLDTFNHGPPKAEHIRNDTVELIHIFYEALGGQRHYQSQPPEVKAIIRGLKRGLILQRFRSAGMLKVHLEMMRWT